jgi:arylsulfatase/uncharacterized sulfatase
MAIEGWDTETDNLGLPGSLAAIGQEWAQVSAAPFDLFKFSASEGGVRVPLIIAGPGVAPVGLVHGRAHVADIAPTLLDLAGAPYPYGEQAFDGRSLAPILTGAAEEVYAETDPTAIEVSGTAALYRGKWKITRTPPSASDGQWRLFDVVADPGETVDMAAAEPQLFGEMLAEYRTYVDTVGVFELGQGESALGQVRINGIKKIFSNYWYVVAIPLLVLLGIIYMVVRVFIRLLRRHAAV